MRRYILKSTLFGFLTAVLAGSAWAHHGWTGYDETKTITLTGVIREASYENPREGQDLAGLPGAAFADGFARL
jgi:hypothetical protein